MFGKINSKQNVTKNKHLGNLLSNPKFIAIPAIISENELYNLIQKYYNNKDKDNLLKSCNMYLEYDFKKYLDIINQYIMKYK
tara:strand:- start:652 stop:897 length:246 start_codon:yes stop_codon:yes gene_type:complete